MYEVVPYLKVQSILNVLKGKLCSLSANQKHKYILQPPILLALKLDLIYLAHSTFFGRVLHMFMPSYWVSAAV